MYKSNLNFQVISDFTRFFRYFWDNRVVREPNTENCSDFIFAADPCEKAIIVPDTNYITSAILKFILDMPSPGGFQNIARALSLHPFDLRHNGLYFRSYLELTYPTLIFSLHM